MLSSDFSMSIFRMSSASPPHRAMRAARVVVSALALTALTACSRSGEPSASTASTEPTADHFVAGMQDYLATRGDLCLAKNEWPIDLTPREIDDMRLPMRPSPSTPRVSSVARGSGPVEA